MNISFFRHALTTWTVAAFYSLDTTRRIITVLFSSNAFERGDDFGVADARIVRDENDEPVRLVVDPATILIGERAFEIYEDRYHEARESMSVCHLMPQPDIEIVFRKS